MNESAFDELVGLMREVDLIMEKEYAFLKGFWNQKLGCFFDREVRDRVNVTSTCFVAFALLSSNEAWSKLSEDFFGGDSDEAKKGLAKVLQETEWASEALDEFNVYTTPIVIVALDRLGVQLDENAKVTRGINSIVDQFDGEGAVRFRQYRSEDRREVEFEYPANAYLSYWSISALHAYNRSAPPGDEAADRARECLPRALGWAETEIQRQLAFDSAHDSDNFDVNQLMYALAAYTQYFESEDVARSEQKSRSCNARLTRRAVQVAFDCQLPNGLWPRGRPVFPLPRAGGAFPFSYEILDALLSRPEMLLDPLSEYVSKMALLIRWAKESEKAYRFSADSQIRG